MKQIFTLLFSLLAITAFSQDITNQLGATDGSSTFIIQNNAATPAKVFTVNDQGSMSASGAVSMGIKIIETSDSPYPVESTDYTIIADANDADIIIDLPPTANNPGRIIIIKNTDSGAGGTHDVIVNVATGDGINGSTQTSGTLDKENEAATIQSDGDGSWWVISSHIGTVVTK